MRPRPGSTPDAGPWKGEDASCDRPLTCDSVTGLRFLLRRAPGPPETPNDAPTPSPQRRDPAPRRRRIPWAPRFDFPAHRWLARPSPALGLQRRTLRPALPWTQRAQRDPSPVGPRELGPPRESVSMRLID